VAVIDFFDRGWRINPSGFAYIQDDRRYTYEEIGKLTCRIANGLLAQGFSRGSRAAVLALNDVIGWSCVLGLFRAGVCYIPINPRNTPEETQSILDRFDCEVLFFQKQFWPVIDSIRPVLLKVRTWICIDGAVEGAEQLETWIGRQPDTVPEVLIQLDDVIGLAATGGTTGAPKGVMNSHRAFQTYFAQFMIAFPYGTARPVNLAAAPMTHTAGMLSMPCTARGGTVVILTKPDPVQVLDTIERERITEFFLPPTVIYRLLDTPGCAGRDYSSLRYFFYGAAPMAVEKLKQAIRVFGPVMAGAYGQTEAPASISYLPPEEHFVDGHLASDERLSSVGRPCALIRVEVMDDTGAVLTQGKTGEICVRGDLLMSGYYKAPEITAETIVNGWLHTGDIGHLDAEGYLHITDRKKDMIISGGFNIYPSEIEQVIWGHEAVRDCAVIGVPDAQWGEAVKAVVELNEGRAVTEEELIALCKRRLGSIKTPKSIDFTQALPRSAVGKVLKKALRDQYWGSQQRRI
jgi:acyl-CoA synthetase (AMP-forming)/AMP-acid ligase II